MMNFHDAKVQGLLFDEADQKLVMQIELSNQEKVVLEFIQVVGWEFSPFEEQNELFEIQEFDFKSLPEWLKLEFNIPEQYVDRVLSGERKIYYLVPSVGLGGYVVAHEVKTL